MSKCFSIPLVSLQSVLFILQHLQAFPASVYTHSSFSLLLWCPHSCLMNLLLVLYPGHWETEESISPSASTTSSLQWGTEAEGWWRPFPGGHYDFWSADWPQTCWTSITLNSNPDWDTSIFLVSPLFREDLHCGLVVLHGFPSPILWISYPQKSPL